jgi:pentatricopeptide repeat protein
VVLITYNTLIDALAKKGEVIKAMALFDEMINGGISPDNVTYGSLVMSFSKKNMAKEALELLNQMLSLGFEVKTTTFESEAAEILRVMVSRNSNLRSAFYLSIVSRVAMSGQLKEAQILHQQLVECKVLKEDSQFILSS